jgi:hypothetical protein
LLACEVISGVRTFFSIWNDILGRYIVYRASEKVVVLRAEKLDTCHNGLFWCGWRRFGEFWTF